MTNIKENDYLKKINKATQLMTLTNHYKKLIVKPESYNLFSVLRSKSDEVKLHSRFLADLLNPRGKHKLNSIPLTLFLNEVLNIAILDGNYDFEVKVEYRNIDIFLINRKTKQAIIIENKINANDQDQQLLRYYLLAKKEGYQDITIIYLTLSGTEPSSYAVEGNLGSLSKNKQKVELLSYKEDINLWLKNLIEKSAQIPSLRESLIQYINIVRELTGMSHDKEYIHELKKLLIDLNCVDIVDNIKEAYTELKQESQVILWENILAKAKLEFGSLSEGDVKNSTQLKELVVKFMSNRTGVNEINIAFPLENFEHCYLSVQTEDDDSLFIGVLNNPSQMNASIRTIEPIDGYQCHSNYPWWPIFKYIEFDGYWSKNLSADQIKKLHNDVYMNELTDHIIDEMKLLKSKLYK